MLSFPDITEPNTNNAENCSESYKMSYNDNTISSSTDAGYKLTRARNTRFIKTYTFSWFALSDDEYLTLLKFYEKVGTFEIFKFTNWIDEKTYEVRFAESLKEWQYNHPVGWQGSLSFEEV